MNTEIPRPVAPGHQPPTGFPTTLEEANTMYMAKVCDLMSRDEALALMLRQQPGQQVLQPTPIYMPPPVYQQTYQQNYRQSAALPMWVLKYCAVSLATGGAIALTGWGLGQAAPALADLAHLFYAIATAGVAGAVIWIVIRVMGAATSGGGGGGGRSGSAPMPQIVQNISTSGMFAKASGTINTR
jgi:hypothetical protein